MRIQNLSNAVKAAKRESITENYFFFFSLLKKDKGTKIGLYLILLTERKSSSLRSKLKSFHPSGRHELDSVADVSSFGKQYQYLRICTEFGKLFPRELLLSTQ